VLPAPADITPIQPAATPVCAVSIIKLIIMKKIKFLIFVIFSLIIVSNAFPQLKKGDHLLGPTIGIWTKGSSVTLGGNYEYQITQAGPGTIAIGAVFRNWSYSSANITYTNNMFGFQTNYNFNKIDNGKFVPFVGIVLGFNNIGKSTSPVNFAFAYSSGFWTWLQGGVRYFVDDNVALVGRFGLGNNDFITPEIGVDFRL